MTLYALPKSRGRGRARLSATSTEITGTGNITTGMSSVDAACTDVNKAGSAGTTADVSSIVAISAGTITVEVTKLTYSGPTNAQETSALYVHCLAVGKVAAG